MFYKILKKAIYTIPFLIIVGGLIFFFGTPWGRYSSFKKAYQYLENKYAQKIIIQDSVYDFKSGGYYFFAYPEGKKDIVFKVVQTNKGMIHFITPQATKRIDYKDNLFNVLWEKEIYNEIMILIKDIYPCPVSVKTHVQKNTVYNDYEKNIEFAKIPKFSDIINKVDWNYVIISFNIEKTLDKSNLNGDSEKIFKILNIIKDNGYKFERIDFNYDSDKKSQKEYFLIYYEEIEKIKNSDDVRKLLEDRCLD